MSTMSGSKKIVLRKTRINLAITLVCMATFWIGITYHIGLLAAFAFAVMLLNSTLRGTFFDTARIVKDEILDVKEKKPEKPGTPTDSSP